MCCTRKFIHCFSQNQGSPNETESSKQEGVLFHMVYIQFVELIGKGCCRSQNYKQVKKIMKKTNARKAVKGYGKQCADTCSGWGADLGQRAGQELAAGPGSRDGQQHSRLHQQDHCQEVGAGIVPSAQNSLLDHICVL